MSADAQGAHPAINLQPAEIVPAEMQILQHEHEISASHGFVEDVGFADAEVSGWGGQG